MLVYRKVKEGDLNIIKGAVAHYAGQFHKQSRAAQHNVKSNPAELD